MQVVFDVNMTVSGDGLTPFSAKEQQALLTPLTTFLGDHGTVNISNTAQAGNNEVRAGSSQKLSILLPVLDSH